MACFIVPAAEAVVASAATKVLKSKEEHQVAVSGQGEMEAGRNVIPFSRKLGWLSKFLWGGSALLAFEHVWHGEIVPWAPFLTAAGSPADMADMLQEIGTVGVGMAVLVTAVWGAVSVTADAISRRSPEKGEIPQAALQEQPR